MKAFISYSVNDNDQSLITLLSMKLREKKFTTSTSQNFYSQELDLNTKNEINSSQLFFGVLTGQGIEKDRVLKEWDYAKKVNTPVLLIIEDTISINKNFKGNYIVFNRNNTKGAISQINNKIQLSKKKDENLDEVLPWLLGGAAALAILAIFNNKN